MNFTCTRPVHSRNSAQFRTVARNFAQRNSDRKPYFWVSLFFFVSSLSKLVTTAFQGCVYNILFITWSLYEKMALECFSVVFLDLWALFIEQMCVVYVLTFTSLTNVYFFYFPFLNSQTELILFFTSLNSFILIFCCGILAFCQQHLYN